jgi:hypothetical protein
MSFSTLLSTYGPASGGFKRLLFVALPCWYIARVAFHDLWSRLLVGENIVPGQADSGKRKLEIFKLYDARSHYMHQLATGAEQYVWDLEKLPRRTSLRAAHWYSVVLSATFLNRDWYLPLQRNRLREQCDLLKW